MKNADERLTGMLPIVPDVPQVLILGSMPGAQSLEKQEYYGNPRNHFWKIMFTIYHEKPIDSYEEKISWLKEKGIALWDTIGSCIRVGSLDANIKEEKANDILPLLKKYPSIKLVICNGGKSYETFRKYIDVKEVEKQCKVVKLPSTSPVPGRYTKSFEEKAAIWKQSIMPNIIHKLEKNRN